MAAARDSGLGVEFITHNPHHAHLVGDRFVLLQRGTMSGSHTRDGITLDEPARRMAGGSEPDDLRHELENRAVRGARGRDPYGSTGRPGPATDGPQVTCVPALPRCGPGAA